MRTINDLIKVLNLYELESRETWKLSRRVYMYLARGPNHMWRCNGYDKPFGNCIHAAIDGWSKILDWCLRVGRTNNTQM